MMPCYGHFYGSEPLELVRGRGTRVWDAAGKEYFDFFTGVAVNSLGHCHPEVVEAVARQLETLQHTTTLYLHESVVGLAETLARLAPTGLSRVFFCADGSGANEGALLAASAATGRRNFIAFDRGLHGRTALTMEVTGIGFWKNDSFPMARAHHVPTPMDEEGAEESLGAVERLLNSPAGEEIAAFIAEPILGNGGIVVPPHGYFRRLKALLRAHGVLLIADEVQTGFCRTGAWFGMQRHGVSPDLMSCAKALGNGLPVAVWLATEEVAAAYTRPAASTFGGNLAAMAAAATVVGIMERDGLAHIAEVRGSRFRALLAGALSGFGEVAEVRGMGMMIGVEIGGPGNAAMADCDRVLCALRDRGILAGKTGPGRNVLTFLPPLTATEEEIGFAAEATREAFAATRGSSARC
ncbi:MAG: alanine-glyoxylate transaminase / (R)-3-amino-2-methylpropionate-pyruvate transaminase [Candidatus Sumerlaeota bacterium]|nr:alanine-glyoxylate transaminase / (R)-3-amino-2-methylpropionate-pyruvate transaminase [Candidatus Sumerlaeota bacterium]